MGEFGHPSGMVSRFAKVANHTRHFFANVFSEFGFKTSVGRTEQGLRKSSLNKFLLSDIDLTDIQSVLLDQIPIGIFETDVLGNCTYVNEPLVQLTGMAREDLLGAGWHDSIHPEDRAMVTQGFAESIAGKWSPHSFHRFLRKDGVVHHVFARSAKIFAPAGVHVGFRGTIQDLTEQTHLREQFQKSESELSQFFKVALDLLCIANHEARFTKVNPAFTSTLGYSSDELLSKSYLEFIHPDDVEATKHVVAAIAQGGRTIGFENRYRAKDGTYRVLNWSATPDSKTGLVYAAARDITEMRRRESELRQIMDAVDRNALVVTADRDRKISNVNDNACKLSGFNREELIGRDYRAMKTGLDARAFLNTLGQTIEQKQAWSGELQNRAKDGRAYVVQAVIAPIVDVEGKFDQFLAIGFDVTVQKESKRLLEEAQRVAKIGSWSLDAITHEVTWSKQMYVSFGRDVILGPPKFQEILAAVHADDRAIWASAVQQCIGEGTPYKLRYRSLRADGTFAWLEANGEAQLDDLGGVVSLSGTCQDVTELMEAEERAKHERSKAIHSLKLASLGEMSAGIAHEINNPLTIIAGMVRLIPKTIDNPNELRLRVEAIEKATDRIAKIVAGLRKFSCSSEQIVYQRHNIGEMIREAVILTSAKAHRSMTSVEIDCQTSAHIHCNEIEIEQVLVNLINNGIDAVKSVENRWVKVMAFDDESTVVLHIQDSGIGIPAGIHGKLFQPFFTTKQVGEGTGLGLSIVKGILDDHQASIELLTDSLNTTFEIRFKKSEVT